MKKTKPLLLSLFYFFLALSPVLADEETSVPDSLQPSLKVSYVRQDFKNQDNNSTGNQNALELPPAINLMDVFEPIATFSPLSSVAREIVGSVPSSTVIKINCGITNEQEQLSKILVTDIQNYLTQSKFEEFKNSEPKNCDVKQFQYRQEVHEVLIFLYD